MKQLDDAAGGDHQDVRDSDSDDGFSDGDDEGARALLGSDDQTRWREGLVRDPTSTWAQVKDIVIEVGRSVACYGRKLTLMKTAPTLLFTTVGLLFTGELLDHVSVSFDAF